MDSNVTRDVIVVHSSDLHIGADSSMGSSLSGSLSALVRVLAATRAAHADLLILAGDTFDNNRQPSRVLDGAARMMAEFMTPIVILPGNHDPLTPDSNYRCAELTGLPNVYVLGLTVEEEVIFPDLGLTVWGRAHQDYSDMEPVCTPRPCSTRWQVAIAHGHYVEVQSKQERRLGSWLIHREELIATGADYIALGHWPQAERVGGPAIHAYYSGSPDDARTVNIVRLMNKGAVEVTRTALCTSKG